MTRDEAILVIMERQAKLAFDNLTLDDLREIAESDVDIWSALGMLKLDEPASLADRIKGALKWGDNSYSMAMAMLNDAGLKIVEK